MRFPIAVLSLLTLACAGLDTEDGSTDPTPEAADGLCRNGQEVAPVWQGEYPGPVVDVQQTVTLPARAEPCGAVDQLCTVSAGLYHPWGRAAKGFATVRPVLRYRVSRDHTADGISYKAGDVVEVTAYLGEGFCSFRINGTVESGECPGMFDEGGDVFIAMNPEAEGMPEVQLFLATCSEGGEGWIEAGAALGTEGVEEGVITGYGTVAPHGTAEGF